jgi:hypothetical protein
VNRPQLLVLFPRAAYIFERNWNPYVPSAPVADYWGQVTNSF